MRTRLDAKESQSVIVDAAHMLLLSDGPSAVTLQAVAKQVGRTHSNLLHHFGSAAGMHRALAERIGQRVAEVIGHAVTRRRQGDGGAQEVVGAMFDAFERDRVGELIGWLALTQQREALEAMKVTIAAMISSQRAAGEDLPVESITLALTLLAIGDSLVGDEVAAATGMERAAARQVAVVLIEALAAREAPAAR